MPKTTRMIACRLNEDDYDKLLEHSGSLGMNQSDYLRHLIRIPVDDDGIATGEACVSLDTWTFGKIYSELIRWGRHYNQAVRAMNTIALHIRKKGYDQKLFETQIRIANEKLERVQEGRYDIQRELERLESMTLIGG